MGVFFNDNFVGAAGTLLDNHAPDTAGTAWTKNPGSSEYQQVEIRTSGLASAKQDSNSLALYYADAPGDSLLYRAELKVIHNGGGDLLYDVGPAVRVQTGSVRSYRVTTNLGSPRLARATPANNNTLLASFTGAASFNSNGQSAILKIEAEGTTLRGTYIDHNNDVFEVEVIDSVNGTGARPGLWCLSRDFKCDFDYFIASDGAEGGGTTLTAEGAAQAQTIGEVTLTQSHVLQPDGISQSQGAGSPTLTQAHVLPPDSISQAQSAGSAALTQAHIIVPAGIAQAQAAGSPDLTQAHTLTPDSLAQVQASGQVTLTAAGTLLVDGLSQATGLSAADLVQAGVLSVHGISQGQSVAEIDLAQAYALVPDGITQQQSAGSPTLTQAHQLAINGLVQAQTIEQAVTAVEDLLSIDGLTQAQGIDSAALTQHHTITPDGLTQAQALQVVSFGGLVVGSLQGKIRIYALYDGDINITPALTGKITIH